MEIKLLEDILISDEVSLLVRENEEVLFSFIPELGLVKDLIKIMSGIYMMFIIIL